MPVSVVTEVEQLAEGWGDLLPSCWTNTVFVTPWWQTTWLDHFGDRTTTRAIAATNGDGTLVGIAPMNVARRSGHLSGRHRPCSTTEIFSCARAERMPSIPPCSTRSTRGSGEALNLESVPEDSPTIRFATAIAGDKGWKVTVEEEDKAPFKSLPGNWDDYVSGLGKKYRHALRQEGAKAGQFRGRLAVRLHAGDAGRASSPTSSGSTA